MARVGERRERSVVTIVLLEVKPDEEAVGTVDGRRSERLVDDRHDSSSFLAEGFGEQELEPWSERPDLVRQDERHLVASRPSECGQPARPPARPALPPPPPL